MQHHNIKDREFLAFFGSSVRQMEHKGAEINRPAPNVIYSYTQSANLTHVILVILLKSKCVVVLCVVVCTSSRIIRI